MTDFLGWEWVFFLNVPVAAVMVVLGPLLLRESRAPRRPRAFDTAGAVTATAAMVACVYAVERAPSAGWLSPQTLGLLVAAALLAALFGAIERRVTAPLVPPRLFRTGTVTGGNTVMFLLGSCAFGAPYTIAQYGQGPLSWSALRSGLTTVPLPALAAVGAYAGQALVSRLGTRAVAVGGLTLIGCACALLSSVPANGSFTRDLLPGLLLFGPGLGACAVAGTAAALGGVAERDSGVASGLSTASFQIGGAFGVAVASSVAASCTTAHDAASGHRAAFTACAVLAATAVCCAFLLLRRPPLPQLPGSP